MISIDVHGLSVCLLWFIQWQREERKCLDPGRRLLFPLLLISSPHPHAHTRKRDEGKSLKTQEPSSVIYPPRVLNLSPVLIGRVIGLWEN
jgi:hypothetical protein